MSTLSFLASRQTSSLNLNMQASASWSTATPSSLKVKLRTTILGAVPRWANVRRRPIEALQQKFVKENESQRREDAEFTAGSRCTFPRWMTTMMMCRREGATAMNVTVERAASKALSHGFTVLESANFQASAGHCQQMHSTNRCSVFVFVTGRNYFVRYRGTFGG